MEVRSGPDARDEDVNALERWGIKVPFRLVLEDQERHGMLVGEVMMRQMPSSSWRVDCKYSAVERKALETLLALMVVVIGVEGKN
jgi:hypothetical protein